MTTMSLALLGLCSVIVGLLVGAVGIGGILLVPTMTFLLGFDVHTAIAAAMFAYIFAGIAGAHFFLVNRLIEGKTALYLFAGAAPGGLAGALVATYVPATVLSLLIAAVVAFAGVDALRKRGKGAERTDPLPGLALVAIGFVTGTACAMSGAGGPLVLIPILVALRTPALAAVGLGQTIQIPIGLLATAGNVANDKLDLLVGAILAAGLVAGVSFGARLASRVHPERLRLILAWVLVAVALSMVARVLADAAG
jgi:uncharacterized membrane protein YfcA